MSRRVQRVGYLTPSEVPDTRLCRVFSIPNSPEWLGNFMGAVSVLTEPENWRKFGTLEPEFCAVLMQQIFDDAFYGESVCELAAPYWDDPEADDASSGEDNPEFPFYEDVANFAIAGFVLYATGSPAAALEYWTIARQFRIAYRKHDLGGILRILIDGDIVSEVDTYAASPELGYVDVISPGSTLRLEFPSTGTVTQIIRKRLWEGEIVPASLRFDEATYTVQQTFDGGATWVNAPEADPRYGVVYLAPPLSSSDVRCDAAANMSAEVERLINDIVNAITIVQMATAILAIVVTLIPGFNLLVALIWAICEAIVVIGQVVVAAAFTPEVYDELTCIFYNNISSDGQMSASQLMDFLEDVDSNIGGTVSTVMQLIAQLWGFVGFSNAGSLGGETGDCTACVLAWCRFTQFNLWQTDAWAGFANPIFPVRTDNGTWRSMPQSGASYLNIERVWTEPCEVSSINFHIGMSDTYFPSGSGVWIGYRIGGVWTNVTSSAYDPPVGISYLGYSTPVADVTGVRLYSQVNGVDVISCYDVEINGVGDNPFTESNCP